MHHEFSRWTGCEPSAISGGLIAALAIVSLRMFVASCHWEQGVGVVLLVVLAAALLISGRPRRTRRLVIDGDVVDRTTRRILLRGVNRVCIVASGGEHAATGEIRFQLVAIDGDGNRCILLSDRDPGRVWSSARRFSRVSGIRIERCIQTRGAPLPNEFTSASHEALHLESRAPVLRPRSVSSLWLAVSGSLFVVFVSLALLRAHWARGTSVSPHSLVLLGGLGLIAAMLPRWGLRAELRCDRPALGAGAKHRVGTSIGKWTGLFGQIVWHGGALQQRPYWLVEAWKGGPQYLLLDGETDLFARRLR